MQRGRAGWQVRRPSWVVVVAAALVGAQGLTGSARAAGPVLGFETLRVGFSGNGRSNLFKAGAWTPVWVQLRGGAERFSGTLELEVPDDDGTPTVVRQPVEIAPLDSPQAVVYTRPGTRNPEITVRLLDARGRVVARGNSANLGVTLDPVLSEELLLVTLGKPQGVEQVTGLPGFAVDKSAGGTVLTVARIESAGQMPSHWYGYDAADAVVIDTNDRELMTTLAARGPALVDWVSRGGHLVVAVGGNWQAVRDSELSPILPAVLAGQERLITLDGLDTFAGSTSNAITPPGSPPALVTKLDQVEARGGKVLAAVGPVPLVVRGAHHFGRVTLVAVDVDQKPFSVWKDRGQFWLRAIDLHRRSGDDASGAVPLGGAGRLYQTGIRDLSSQLRQALEQFPGVKLVPFGWVAFFIFLYILLIGPGDYLFLKKVVRRMELTWVTFPLIVLAVSLAAYLGAYAIKGKELRVNKLDVLDIDQTSAGTAESAPARGSTFFNVFSPQNRDYDVAVLPQPVDRPAASEEAAPGFKSGDVPARPAAGSEVLVSWMGVPESGFGGMGGGGQVGFTAGGYGYHPPGQFERIEGVRIPIWSTKFLTARWSGIAPLAAASDLVPVGSDRLAGTVTNRLAVPMNEAIVAFGRHVYELGTLAPGVPVRVELSRDRQLPGLLKDRSKTYLPGPDGSAQGGRINQANLALALMFHGSQGGTAGDRPLPSDPLRYLDLTGLLALDHPMLVGRVDGAAARLVLGNAPSPPRVEQTTMIRVVLPLGKPPG